MQPCIYVLCKTKDILNDCFVIYCLHGTQPWQWELIIILWKFLRHLVQIFCLLTFYSQAAMINENCSYEHGDYCLWMFRRSWDWIVYLYVIYWLTCTTPFLLLTNLKIYLKPLFSSCSTRWLVPASTGTIISSPHSVVYNLSFYVLVLFLVDLYTSIQIYKEPFYCMDRASDNNERIKSFG